MKAETRQSFWFNLLLVIGIFTVIYILFFLELGCFTHHGESVTIPNLRGRTMNEAIDILHKNHFEVRIDSTFDPTVKPLIVLKQVPDTGSVVKTGRIVLVTVNSVTPLHIPMPNLVNLSYRSAELLLRNNKLAVGDTTYVPDIARGAIKEQRYKGEIIRAGDMIAQGSKIDLVIGNGLGNTEWEVPDVTGLSVDEATTIINQFNLIPNMVGRDGDPAITDTPSAIIVDQNPRAVAEDGKHNHIKMGDVIDIIISQNPAPGDVHSNNKDDKTVNDPDAGVKKNKDEDE